MPSHGQDGTADGLEGPQPATGVLEQPGQLGQETEAVRQDVPQTTVRDGWEGMVPFQAHYFLSHKHSLLRHTVFFFPT